MCGPAAGVCGLAVAAAFLLSWVVDDDWGQDNPPPSALAGLLLLAAMLALVFPLGVASRVGLRRYSRPDKVIVTMFAACVINTVVTFAAFEIVGWRLSLIGC